MARREYTQTVKPVSRIPEKIFGWLAWLSLLGLIGYLLYTLLVSGNDPNFINNATNEFERQLAENPQLSELQNYMNDNNLTASEFLSMMIKGAWTLLAIGAVPLILGLIGLLSMKKRILAGILLLLAGLLTAPLFLTIVLFWIPLFFIIAAILLFARKDKVIRNAEYTDTTETYERHREAAPVYVDRDETVEQQKNYTYTEQPVEETVERPVDREQVLPEEEVVTTRETVIDHTEHVHQSNDNVTYHSDNDRDRVKFVDKTIDATEERRQNYNNNRRD